MKSLKARDNWRKLSRIQPNNYCSSIDLDGFNGFGKIDISPKLQIFCGLNGAGKSTILSALKSTLGLELSRQESIKLSTNTFKSEVIFDKQTIICQNTTESKLTSQIECDEKIQFYDYFNFLKILDFLCEQENFEELLEQYSSFPLENDSINEIRYLIGKNYESIEVYELDEYEEYGTIPFFEVVESGIKYDSRKMGIGEYSLLYCYWQISKCNESIIIIEEPESFIAIESQKKLMNIIMDSILTHHNSFIISTHSPFILQFANEENIKIISKSDNRTAVLTPEIMDASSILGIQEDPSGILFVEDSMAADFLRILLKKEKSPLRKRYIIKIAGGSGEITSILKLECLKNDLFTIIGIYDDDQRDKDDDHKDLKLPYCFLPPKIDVEDSMIKLIKSKDVYDEVRNALNIEESDYINIMSQINGLEKHDWFKQFLALIEKDQLSVLEVLYDIWKKDNEEIIKSFLKELEQYQR